MKLFIAIDLEGISGVVSEADTAREGATARRARDHMRGDLDAVLEGCAAAGASEVVVCDAHDDGRNLDPAGLPDQRDAHRRVAGARTACSRGWAPDCAGALFVGYHAMAGTPACRADHPWNYKVSRLIGGLARGGRVRPRRPARRPPRRARRCTSGGDDKAAGEARALVPGIATTVVKTGSRREAAAFVPPEKARARMRADVEAALRASAWPAPLAGAATRCGSPSPGSRTATRRGVPGRQAAGRAHARGRRLDFEESTPGFLGCLRPRTRSGKAGGGPGAVAVPPPLWSIVPPSGCGVAGSTSASQAEDAGSSPVIRSNPLPPCPGCLRPSDAS